MNTPNHPPDDKQDDLVAYLDGELDEKIVQEVEQTLSKSSEVREKIETLAQTWDMLDYLPYTKASEQFTEQTMSSIQVVRDQEPARNGFSLSNNRRGIIAAGWSAGLTAAATIGFLFTHSWVDSPSDQLLSELPVIENLDIYTEIGSVEYLTLLQESHLFDEEQQ